MIKWQVDHGDCLELLKTMPDASVDAVVTDPPYGLSFMGKKWDYDVPSVEVWAECLRVLKPGGHLLSFAGTRTQHRMAVRIEDAGLILKDTIMWLFGKGMNKSETTLKPAYEPIIVAQRDGTPLFFASSCLVPYRDAKDKAAAKPQGRATSKIRSATGATPDAGRNMERVEFTPKERDGRWPANVIHDGTEEVTRDMGDASRYFYCSKASKSDRGEGNPHPTVKPTALMQYLCRLVTPPGGTVLDPFCGSGSTGKAAMLEGLNFIGMEREAEYVEIARRRIAEAAARFTAV